MVYKNRRKTLMCHRSEGLSQSLLTHPQVTFKAQPCKPCGVGKIGMQWLQHPSKSHLGPMLLLKETQLSAQSYLRMPCANRSLHPLLVCGIYRIRLSETESHFLLTLVLWRAFTSSSDFSKKTGVVFGPGSEGPHISGGFAHFCRRGTVKGGREPSFCHP